MIRIIDARFLISTPSLKEALSESVPEIAFLGRSNVGKSSLINALTHHKNLAKKSSTPGKTRLINFYDITYNTPQRHKVHFIDLPGFGYAKVSKNEQGLWEKNLTNFIQNRLCLRIFLLLIDSRHLSLEIDKRVHDYLQSIKKGDQLIITVFTKFDKLNQKQIHTLKQKYPNALMVSVLKKRGLEELNELIYTSLLGDVHEV